MLQPPYPRVRFLVSFSSFPFLYFLSHLLFISYFHVPRPSEPACSGTPMSLDKVRSLLRHLPSPLRFRGQNLNPDRGTVLTWIISRLYSSFMGFAVHDNSLMKFRCRICYKEYPYSGGVTTVKRHMSSRIHMTRLNAHRYYMGLDLVDAANKEHTISSSVAKSDLVPMLTGMPALPLEPFVVLEFLDVSLFPPSEVTLLLSQHCVVLSRIMFTGQCCQGLFFPRGVIHLILR